MCYQISPKLKSAEQYCVRLLQLYTSWRQESDLKYEDGTHESKYKEFENQIVENVRRYEPYLGNDYEKLESRNF